MADKRQRSLSIKSILGIVYILTMCITMSSVSYIVFSNWTASAENLTQELAGDATKDIYYQVDMFLHKAEHINAINSNIIQNRVIEIADEKQREKFFVGALQSYDKEIYSISYGTVNGEYYGARRNEKGILEIMRNSGETVGHSWYYAVKEDLSAGERVLDAGKFDPRQRAWYQVAEKSQKPTFSPTYKHFVMNDLAISAAWPVYNEKKELQGVLATHMLISGIGDYLAEIARPNNGYAAIFDKNSGKIIASSLQKNGKSSAVMKNGVEISSGKIDEDTLQDIYRHYGSTKEHSFLHLINNQRMFIGVDEYQKEGLNWVIISALPETLLLAEVARNIKTTIILLVLAVAVLFIINFIATRKLLQPMNNLLEVAEHFSAGELQLRAEVIRRDEIGRIAEAFNKVADKMSGLINNLENIVEARTEELEYLNCHDPLTGLKNRRCFENSLQEIDNEEHLPLSVIFADINGLKMTNDIFGHAAGDQLIKKTAEILKDSCKENDIIGRVGGDEFIILLPNTSGEGITEIIEKINSSLRQANVAAIKCSISMGFDTKTTQAQSMEEIMANAENKMYKDKVLNRKAINADIIGNIMTTLRGRNKKEKLHSEKVSFLSGKIGEALGFSATKIKRVTEAGYLHDIGKIVLDEKILNGHNLSEAEIEIKRQHPIVGYRILNLFDDTLDLAEAVYSHHENWDGTGYPKGLRGNEIPVMARIIAVAEAYDEMTNEYGNLRFDSATALQRIKEMAGNRLDPEITEAFISIIAESENQYSM